MRTKFISSVRCALEHLKKTGRLSIKVIVSIVCILLGDNSEGQSFLNGDFENTLATEDKINVSNTLFNSLMKDAAAFGTNGNIDIITSDSFCGGPKKGNWFIALTGGGTDAISLKLSSPLVQGEKYSITFYQKTCISTTRILTPLQLGVSETENTFGSLVYTSPAATNSWNVSTFTFTAPNNGQYITIRLSEGNAFTAWTHLDNFSLKCVLDVNIGNDTSICEGKTLVLRPTVANAVFLWNDNSTLSSYTVTSPGIYWVTIVTNHCSNTDTVKVQYKNCQCSPLIPNAFTPNGDGINDTWIIRAANCDSKINVSVFNRYGQLVFSAVDYQNNWTGTFRQKPLPAAAYYYIANATYGDSQNEFFSGSILILR